MPVLQFALEPRGPRRLEICWTPDWRHTSVRLDGASLGSFETKEELEQGREFRLNAGSVLTVQRPRHGWLVPLEVHLDGRRIFPSGFVADPQAAFRRAVHTLWLIGAINAATGLWIMYSSQARTPGVAAGLVTLVYGLAFLVLGALARRTSMAALRIAVGLQVFSLVVNLFQGLRPGPFILGLGFLFFMLRGVKALKTIRGQALGRC